MNLKQKTLAALLVLGIGVSGCNTNDNNLIPQIVNKNTDENKTDPNPPGEDNNTDENRTATILGYIGSQHSDHNSTITVAQLKAITPALSNINDDYQDTYRNYIASADSNISSPATRGEVQSMIDEVNDLNLPEHAILDRSFFKKTNGIFEHRFVYLAVKNNTTGRTWLNNNLGADYANVDSSAYNASQQATAYNDHLAYGSFFQWGRKADGHELMNWTDATTGTAKYGDTSTKVDDPSDSLFITSGTADWKVNGDWRVNQDDTLWANESSANNVCPVGYRLPLDLNGADDSDNEFAVEINTWSSKDVNGSMSSDLKLPLAGFHWIDSNLLWMANHGDYWTSSVVPSDGNNSTVSNARNILLYRTKDFILHDTTHRGSGMSVRCIKTERSASILKEIGNEHSNNKSTITIAQLKAITPEVRDINDDYQDTYRSYIASADTNISSPATVDEVQSMIDEVNALNLPEHAILDRSFFKKTNGVFEHRFVYLPVTNSKTGRTWLNNNLGADYANVDSSAYNASQQATAYNDHLAYGSLFQWGRKADGHELINWTSSTSGTGKYGETSTKADEPSDPLFITFDIADREENSDWRVNQDDTLWASESSANSVCPAGYRLPLKPNKAYNTAHEFYVEIRTWSSPDHNGSMSSDLKLSAAGARVQDGSVNYTSDGGAYWTGSIINAQDTYILWLRGGDMHTTDYISSYRGHGFSVRCIKD